MYVLFLVRVLVRIRMLDHAASRLGLENDPRAVALFQVIGHLHAWPLRRAVLRSKFNFGVGLIAVDGNTSDIHHHGSHVQRFDFYVRFRFRRTNLVTKRATGAIFRRHL